MKGLRRAGNFLLLGTVLVGTTLAFAAVGKKIVESGELSPSAPVLVDRAINPNDVRVDAAEERTTSPEGGEPSTATESPSPTPPGMSPSSHPDAPSQPASPSTSYPLHQAVTATLFWAGEEAGEDNKNISNLPSAWDEKWVKHYGGVDNPNKRNGYFPSGFTPKENPFYFALPYNDFDSKGKRRAEAISLIPWARERAWKDNESMLKNQWVKVTKGGKSCYAQWQDVGPFKEDDSAYVFGSAAPRSKTNKHAGIDLSPAVNQFLGLEDIDTVDWQFVAETDVPDGPWKNVVTTSQVYWN